MADPYGLELSGLDPEYVAELRKLSKQERMAEELAKRGMQPLQGQMVGGVYVRPSIFQGLSNIANSWVAKGEQDKVEEGYKLLGEKWKAQDESERQKIIDARQGTPEIPIPEDGMGPGRPAIPASHQNIINTMLQSRIPEFRKGAMQIMVAEKTKQAEPYTLAAGASRYGPNDELIVTAPNKPTSDKESDQIIQYRFAKTPEGGNYKGTFDQFKTLGPAITAAAIAPLRHAQVENINAENNYNLPPARLAPPKLGQVVDGYKFKGGDPANQSNWEKQ